MEVNIEVVGKGMQYEVGVA
ncbi:uncharacterized protein G2W53_030974 [Senna tora]|uniref:Uncharacterized protein n=1 Tax=Senna tora TaxID=362788 RepID=A0A834T8F3_9FABA|nr:uncharacterized protein G2W53_030974 [Senna tora]